MQKIIYMHKNSINVKVWQAKNLSRNRDGKFSLKYLSQLDDNFVLKYAALMNMTLFITILFMIYVFLKNASIHCMN